ncbi:nickel pincer cofactor biosynthesis protein LarB [Haloarcula salinisoli]|uniref:Nickel pincer cofactor biosynthesis protein LarB n=1 Tax=Haloarcula salinisoli TaxID=2487746 RepID=A0A8J7YNC3_9EURY|nr:nickel pincer cofactor biosynthesis protein LarB [Halomicroarcula salinisoli]MBX0287026.1 nickel pincer cofactor biosynthesis protein LarB [Halomicroarcula salinisoli]MBX0304328.1 nickel pincer cofactor biosynthesis protein LarB [Halomicroarcula salinisoli]
MREILEAVAAGELTPAEAESELAGYATTGAGRFDAARKARSGVPEAVLGSGKTVEEIADLAATAVETTGRAIVTRIDAAGAGAVRRQLAENAPKATIRWDERSNWLVATAPAFERPDVDARVGVVTAGTSDAVPAGEAAMIAAELGADVTRIDDVGVASLARTIDAVSRLREQDVLVVAAGREGALPTVVAGLVDTPVIGLPVSTGYGHGGEGEAALSGMLQSCTALSVVNVDAGFTAGTQAGLIARRVAAARGG